MMPSPFVQRLNEHQCNVGPGWPMHPYTCGYRDQDGHFTAGGDLGLLIATEDGWRCPACQYEQEYREFERAIVADHPRLAAESSIDDGFRALFHGHARDSVACYIGEYTALLAGLRWGAGRSAAENAEADRMLAVVPVMLACLRRRQLELEGVSVEQGTPTWEIESQWSAIEMNCWPDYAGTVELLVRAEGPSIANPSHPGYGPDTWIVHRECPTDDFERFRALEEAGVFVAWRPASGRFAGERVAAKAALIDSIERSA